MKILEIFRKKEHNNPFEFTDEQYVFQHCFRRYYVRKINGDTELWARDTKDERLNFYIGKLVGDKVMLTKAFYTHPYDIQKGAGRLVRIFLHNDWTEL